MYRISNKHRIPSLLYILLLVSTPANINIYFAPTKKRPFLSPCNGQGPL